MGFIVVLYISVLLLRWCTDALVCISVCCYVVIDVDSCTDTLTINIHLSTSN